MRLFLLGQRQRASELFTINERNLNEHDSHFQLFNRNSGKLVITRGRHNRNKYFRPQTRSPVIQADLNAHTRARTFCSRVYHVRARTQSRSFLV